jgi:eukaryotic-like serine/threonine-protein kinase
LLARGITRFDLSRRACEPEERMRQSEVRHTEGELLFDRFGVLEELGSGGFGTVVRAFDYVSGHEVAVKLLHRGDQEGTERFKKEFRALVELEHPNLVRLGELFERQKRWAFSMELVRGDAFLKWIRPGSAAVYDEQRLRAGLSQLATAIEALHSAGLLHRDIKPANVRVTPEGRLVLLDFGLVTQLAAGVQSTTRSIVGTIDYMAPERCESLPSTAASDMYSFGVLLYEALTQRLPFTGDLRQVLLAKYAQTPVPPRILHSYVPEDLNDLCVGLMALDPRERPSASEALARLGGPITLQRISVAASTQDDVFVGREAELRTLFAAFERAPSTGPSLLLIEGESGIGKSALIAEFCRRLRKGRRRVEALAGRCHAFEHVTYKAFDEIVDQLARMLRARGPSAPALPESCSLLPLLFPMLSRGTCLEGAVKKPRAERTELFDAFRALLATLGAESAIVITIDDLQWADAESVALLKDLLDYGELPDLLLVASCRPVDAEGRALLEPLLGHRQTTRLTLDVLPRSDARLLLSAIWPGADSADEDAVLDESRGHPMFLRELSLREARQAATGKHATLDEAILDRVSVLESTVRDVLAHVCLSASPLPHGILADALGLNLGLVYRALTALRTEHLVRNAQPGDVLAYHDRVREAVSHALSEPERAQIHRGLARAFLRQSEPAPARIAHHLLGCGEEQEAAPWLERAAQDALSVAAFERAAELFAQRLALTSAALSPELSRALLRAQANALAQAGRCSDSARVLAQVLETAVGEERRDLLVRCAQQLLQAGEIERGLAAARTVLKEMDLPWPDSELSAFARLGVNRLLSLAQRGSLPSSQRSSALDELKLDTMSRLLQPLFWADLLRCADMAARYERLAWRCGSPAHIARALGVASVFSAMQNPDDNDLALSTQAEHWVARDGTEAVRAYQELTRGGSLVFTARFGEAARHFERAEEIYCACQGEAWMETNSRGPHLGAMFLAGDHKNFVLRSAHWLREASGRGDAFGTAQLTLVGRGASRHMIADAPERALAEIEQVMQLWRVGHFGLHHFYEADLLHHTLTYAHPEQAHHWWDENRRELSTLSKRLKGFISDMLETYRAEALLRYALHTRSSSLLSDVYRRALRIEHIVTPRARARGSLLRAQVAAYRGAEEEARCIAERAARQLGAQGEFRGKAGTLLVAALGSVRERDQAEQELLSWLAAGGWKNPTRAMEWMLPVITLL